MGWGGASFPMVKLRDPSGLLSPLSGGVLGDGCSQKKTCLKPRFTLNPSSLNGNVHSLFHLLPVITSLFGSIMESASAPNTGTVPCPEFLGMKTCDLLGPWSPHF